MPVAAHGLSPKTRWKLGLLEPSLSGKQRCQAFMFPSELKINFVLSSDLDPDSNCNDYAGEGARYGWMLPKRDLFYILNCRYRRNSPCYRAKCTHKRGSVNVLRFSARSKFSSDLLQQQGYGSESGLCIWW